MEHNTNTEQTRYLRQPKPLTAVPLHLGRTADEEASRLRASNRNRRYMNLCFYSSFIFFAAIVLVGMIVSLHFFFCNYYMASETRFMRLRNHLVERERMRRIGGKLVLNAQELLADEQLLVMKRKDEEKRLLSDYESIPHYLSKYRTNGTQLYEVLRSMPKGGLLHVHDTGMFKPDVLIELCRYSDLWVCVDRHGTFHEFRFAKSIPPAVCHENYGCAWQFMRDRWFHNGENKTVAELRELLSFNPNHRVSPSNLTKRLRRLHRLIMGLITYRPVWSNYIFRMLEEFYADGVLYVELRSSLPTLYDFDCSNLTIVDTACALKTVTNIFQKNYCDFIGTKLIYAPVQESNDADIDTYVANAFLLKNKFPGFFVGLDLMSLGNECQAQILKENTVQLLHISKEIDFYFHAGESICYNSNAPDENLIDAILLGSKRIRNTAAMPRHPEVIRIIKLLNVAMEVCPLSDHYLQYINDFQLHPAAYFIAAGYPVVIGSDYPHFWNATPLTDDFYMAFVGIATNYGNLAMLKQLAMNSLLYSSMSASEKSEAMQVWSEHWNNWVVDLNKDYI